MNRPVDEPDPDERKDRVRKILDLGMLYAEAMGVHEFHGREADVAAACALAMRLIGWQAGVPEELLNTIWRDSKRWGIEVERLVERLEARLEEVRCKCFDPDPSTLS